MWKGQFNAILVLLLLGSCATSIGTENPDLFTGGLVFVVLIWFAGTLASLISSAFFGFPLLYSRKHKTTRTHDGATTRES
jgi:hypothetical protein